jgi:hypothetical protein
VLYLSDSSNSECAEGTAVDGKFRGLSRKRVYVVSKCGTVSAFKICGHFMACTSVKVMFPREVLLGNLIPGKRE